MRKEEMVKAEKALTWQQTTAVVKGHRNPVWGGHDTVDGGEDGGDLVVVAAAAATRIKAHEL